MNAVKMKASAASAAALLKGLANRHRLLILCHLADGERSVGQLEVLLRLRQPHLSQHLARLRRDRLVETRRVSRIVYYRLGSSAAARVMRLLYEIYCSRAARRRPAFGSTARRSTRTRTAATTTRHEEMRR
jgi:ArsR family transcriptional regulator, virulence genes transcriptional regulator